MKKILLSIIIVMIVFTVFAQNKNGTGANIVGHVISESTSQPIPYVNISLKGTTLWAQTDTTGHYKMNNLPVGQYQLVANLIGYKTIEKEVTIEKGKTIEVNFTLEQDVVMLNSIVVSANKNETNRNEAVNMVNVITPKTFENTSSVCLADGLSYQPGLRIEYECQNCGSSQLRINGLEGSYSQILIDSRAVNSALAGVYGLEQIPVNMIDRVEVVRGGGSALFGSNAVAGTVNIITKDPTANSLQLSNTTSLIGGTAWDVNTSFNAMVVSNNNKAGIAFFGTSRLREPYDANGDSYSEIPKLNSKSIGFRGYYRLNNISKLTFEYHNIYEFRRGGNDFDLPPHEADIAEQAQCDIHSGGLKYDLFLKGNKHAIQVYSSAQHIGRDSYAGAGKDLNAYGLTTDISAVLGAQYVWRMKKCFFMPADFTGGAEMSYNNITDNITGYDRFIDQTTRIYSLFLQNEWHNKTLTLLLGGRLDKHNLIDNLIFSPRVSARYAPWEWLNIRTSYTQGFRAPQAFNEDLHVEAVGGEVSLISLADDLKPEMSNSVTFSMEFSNNKAKMPFLFMTEFFYTDLKDVFILEEIGRDDAGNLLLERRNGSGAVVSGLNFEFTFVPYRRLKFNGSFTYQSSLYKEAEKWSEDIAPQRKMFRSPNSYGSLMATYMPVKNFEIDFSGTYTGPMLVQHYAGYVAKDILMTTSSFFDINLKIAYDFHLKENTTLQLNAGIKNILNSYQKDFDQGENRDSGYIYGPIYPRTFFFGLKFMI